MILGEWGSVWEGFLHGWMVGKGKAKRREEGRQGREVESLISLFFFPEQISWILSLFCYFC